MFCVSRKPCGALQRKLLATKHAEVQAEKEGKATRNEERNQAKALKVAREVNKGVEVLNTLELYGNPKLINLTFPDMLAVLTNADPQGNEKKPKDKSDAMLRVHALS